MLYTTYPQNLLISWYVIHRIERESFKIIAETRKIINRNLKRVYNFIHRWVKQFYFSSKIRRKEEKKRKKRKKEEKTHRQNTKNKKKNAVKMIAKT